MKKVILLFTVLLATQATFAQNEEAQPTSTQASSGGGSKEVGVIFNDFDNFGLTYRFGKTSSAMWRVQTLFLNGNTSSQDDDKSSYFGIGARFGREYRKNIADNFEFRYGVDLAFEYSHSKQDVQGNVQKQNTYTPGVYAVLGVNYVVKERLVIGAELLPGISYSTTTYNYDNSNQEPDNRTGFNYGFSNNAALLSLAYRF